MNVDHPIHLGDEQHSQYSKLLLASKDLERSTEISVTVVEIAGYPISEDVRQHHKYLSHLLLTCEINICELALQPPVVSKETLEMFPDDIEKRKRQCQKKAWGECHRECRIEMEENKKQGKYLEPTFPWRIYRSFLPSTHIPALLILLWVLPALRVMDPFPFLLLAEVQVLMQTFCGPLCHPLPVRAVPHSALEVWKKTLPSLPLPSCCRMEKAKADVWPKTAPKKDENSLVPPAPVGSDNSDCVPVPSFQNSFSQAIEAAFVKLDTPSTSDPLSEEKGGKKRKKKKQKLLFSTLVIHTK
ncbi:RING finger protein 10 [Heterocephalus glaber]|uniref:RING finger protein 10 n=1 Tax=Heterocephalus glaber TaxID=10181 RepID=G5C1Y7_HETGA|nr:RING finger protein 10 [Heterocephalus glaber]